MNSIDQISLSLGKGQLPDLFFEDKIPPQWEIRTVAFNGAMNSLDAANTSIACEHTGVVYNLNNLGYRSNFDFGPDLQNHRCVLLLGCSDVFGCGVEDSQTMYNVMSKSLSDHKILNLSYPGASADFVSRVACQSIKFLKQSVTDVCVLWPFHSQREFVSKRFRCGIHTQQKDFVPMKDWWSHVDWVSNNYNYWKNYNLVDGWCKSVGAKLHSLLINRNDPNVGWDIVEIGPYKSIGPDSHVAIADYFIRSIQGRPSFWQESRNRSLSGKTQTPI